MSLIVPASVRGSWTLKTAMSVKINIAATTVSIKCLEMEWELVIYQTKELYKASTLDAH